MSASFRRRRQSLTHSLSLSSRSLFSLSLLALSSLSQSLTHSLTVTSSAITADEGAFVRSVGRSVIQCFLPSFLHSFIRSFVPSFVPSFSFVRPLIFSCVANRSINRSIDRFDASTTPHHCIDVASSHRRCVVWCGVVWCGVVCWHRPPAVWMAVGFFAGDGNGGGGS